MGVAGVRRGAWAQPLEASSKVSSTRLIKLCRMIEVTATPDASRPHATSTSVAATRPTRSGMPAAPAETSHNTIVQKARALARELTHPAC